MEKPKAPWLAISAVAGVGIFLAAAFGGPIVLWRDLGSQITEQGHRLEAKIDAQGDSLEAKIEAYGDRLEAKIEAESRETREFHRQMLEQIRDLYVRHSDLKERVAVLEAD